MAQLRAKAAAVGTPSVAVSFSAAYAMPVHENLEAHHPVGQAKFLEQPAREMGPELAATVRTAVQQGRTVGQGLLLAGLKLQGAAQRLCPVKTGFLRNSANTRLE